MIKLIKLNTIYGVYNPKDKCGYFIVIIRNPKTKCYELHKSVFLSYLNDFDYLLKERDPLFAFDNLSDARYYARKIINGEDFY